VRTERRALAIGGPASRSNPEFGPYRARGPPSEKRDATLPARCYGERNRVRSPAPPGGPPITAPLSLADVAAAPAWPLERVRALDGRCRGALLRDWADHLGRDFGAAAVERLRADLALPAGLLPDAPERRAWFPVPFQLMVTRYAGERLLDGDLLALEARLHDAGHRTRDRVVEWAIATVGPGVVFKNTERIHRWLYDRGRARTTVHRNNALFEFQGAEFFAEPTWRLLQCFAVRAAIRLLKRDLRSLEAFDRGPDAFAVAVTWS